MKMITRFPQFCLSFHLDSGVAANRITPKLEANKQPFLGVILNDDLGAKLDVPESTIAIKKDSFFDAHSIFKLVRSMYVNCFLESTLLVSIQSSGRISFEFFLMLPANNLFFTLSIKTTLSAATKFVRFELEPRPSRAQNAHQVNPIRLFQIIFATYLKIWRR